MVFEGKWNGNFEKNWESNGESNVWYKTDGEWELERLLLEWGKSGHPCLQG